MLEPIIRRATESDLPAISEIYNHAVLHTTATYDYEPESIDRRQHWFREHEELRLPVFVAMQEGQLLGWSSISPFHRRPGFRFTVENSIYVAEAHRGQGLGGLLLAPLIQVAAVQGLHSIIAAIDASNAVSVHLHEKFGFREIGRFPSVGYKFDRWLDVAYLQRFITAGDAAAGSAKV